MRDDRRPVSEANGEEASPWASRLPHPGTLIWRNAQLLLIQYLRRELRDLRVYTLLEKLSHTVQHALPAVRGRAAASASLTETIF